MLKKPLFEMSPHKALGIDGFPASFLKKGWESLKTDLLNFVSQVFSNRCVPKEVTDSLTHGKI